MALILKKKKSNYQSSWYEKNKQRLSEKRKKLYKENPEYRQRALERSERRRRGEVTLTTPPADAPISFEQAAERIGIGISTLHEWRKEEYFPEPKHHNGRRLWFNEKQVLLLKDLKDKGKRQRNPGCEYLVYPVRENNYRGELAQLAGVRLDRRDRGTSASPGRIVFR